MKQSWCFAFRPTPGNASAKSRVNSFFISLKTFLKSSCPSATKRAEPSESLKLILDFISSGDSDADKNPVDGSVLDTAMSDLCPDLIVVGQKFASHDEAVAAVRRHGDATNQGSMRKLFSPTI